MRHQLPLNSTAPSCKQSERSKPIISVLNSLMSPMKLSASFTCCAIGLLSFVSAPASAATKWEPITLTELGLFYIDPKSITEEEGRRKVWSLLDYKKIQHTADDKSYLSVQSQVQVNCKMKMARVMHVTYYSGAMLSGQTVLKQGMLHEWLEIDPASPVQKIARRIC